MQGLPGVLYTLPNHLSQRGNNRQPEDDRCLQVIHAVAIDNQSLRAPEGTPRGYVDLMYACMNRDPEARPTFAGVRDAVTRLRAELIDELDAGADVIEDPK